MSCEYCRGEKALLEIDNDLSGLGAIIEGDELRVYTLIDGYFSDDAYTKIRVCPTCGSWLPVPGAKLTHTWKELGLPDMDSKKPLYKGIEEALKAQ